MIESCCFAKARLNLSGNGDGWEHGHGVRLCDLCQVQADHLSALPSGRRCHGLLPGGKGLGGGQALPGAHWGFPVRVDVAHWPQNGHPVRRPDNAMDLEAAIVPWAAAIGFKMRAWLPIKAAVVGLPPGLASGPKGGFFLHRAAISFPGAAVLW